MAVALVRQMANRKMLDEVRSSVLTCGDKRINRKNPTATPVMLAPLSNAAFTTVLPVIRSAAIYPRIAISQPQGLASAG
ncbi:hypothetical protein D3C72_1658070 [compost metagenome]